MGERLVKTKDSPFSVVEVDELPMAWGGFWGLESCPGGRGYGAGVTLPFSEPPRGRAVLPVTSVCWGAAVLAHTHRSVQALRPQGVFLPAFCILVFPSKSCWTGAVV